MHAPPFCPNPACDFHHLDDYPEKVIFWVRNGTYTTKVSGTVQRFLCSSCGIGFSERTWSIDYFTKRNIDYHEIHRATVSSESLTSIARHLGCTVASIQNRQDRLGRNCVALQARLLAGHTLNENLCADAFESFDRSQYFPNAINNLIGVESQFLYGSTHATLRRKGRMTSSQKRKRDVYDTLFLQPKGILTRSFSELVGMIVPLWKPDQFPKLILKTDEHPLYPKAIARVSTIQKGKCVGSFTHETYSSKAPRTLTNPLFPVNYYDRELRKDIAAFRRESTCFTRNVANGLMRFSLYTVWHNYFKPHRIISTAQKPKSAAVIAGMDEMRIEKEKRHLYSQRAFISHQKLNEEETRIWLKQHPTPLKEKQDYCPRFTRAGYLQAS